MNKKELLFFVLFTALVTCIFFAKVIFLRQIPFPGDLLIDSSPFKTESYLGYAPGGYPNKAQGRDVIAQLFPWKYFSITQLKNGQLPLWNPYNFSGNAHIANYQTGVFYPVNIVFFILPFIPSWSVFIILQPILALCFMYLFLRSLRISTIPSFIGSIAFAFSSYMTVWFEWGNIGHTLLWLPLMLFAIRKYVTTQKFSSAFVFVIAGVCCLLAGYIQGAFYVFLVTLLYGLFFAIQKKENKLLYLVPGLFVITLAISALQILPTIVVFLNSTRDAYTHLQIQNLLNPWYYPVTLFVSEFFGNPATRNFSLPITYFERVMYPSIPILFFALYALQKIRNFEVKFFGIVAAIVLILTTNLPGVSWIYALPIPVLSTTVPTRLLSVFIFSIIVLAAFGIDYWVKKKDIKSLIPYIFAGVYILLWIGVFLVAKVYPQWLPYITVAKHNLILSTGIAVGTLCIFFLRYKFVRVASIVLVVLVFIDLFYIFTKFTPFSPASFVYPSTPVVSYLRSQEGMYRSWGYGNAYIPANYATALGIYSADGYDSLFNKDYGRLLNSSGIGKIQLPLSRTDANIAPGYGSEDLKTNTFRQKMLDLLGVKYVLNLSDGNGATSDNGTFPPEKYHLIWNNGQWQIYQNLEVYPRFFLAGNYKITSPQKDIKDFYATGLKNTILLYQKPSMQIAQSKGDVTLQKYQPNRVVFTTQTASNQLLFLSDTYDSDWKATVDGNPATVYKADVAFRAVEVPKGKHTIIFSYHSQSFDIGLGISLVTIIVGGSYLLMRKLLH